MITVPGAYAAREARKALELGKHVFLFSDNVPLEQEVELKQLAKARRRLVMGPGLRHQPDRRDRDWLRQSRPSRGGGRGRRFRHRNPGVHQPDPSGRWWDFPCNRHWRLTICLDAVGGITTLMGLDILEADPSTQVIALISKPSGAETSGDPTGTNPAECRKPVVGCLLGLNQMPGLRAQFLPG